MREKVIALDCFSDEIEYALRIIYRALVLRRNSCCVSWWHCGQMLQLLNHIFPCAQLKGSDLEITLTRGSSKPGPACAYVNLNICTDGIEQGKSIWIPWFVFYFSVKPITIFKTLITELINSDNIFLSSEWIHKGKLLDLHF